VETPRGADLIDAKQALRKRAQWVTRHLNEIHKRRAGVLNRRYVSGETVFYLGRRYSLKVLRSDSDRNVKMLRGQVRVAVTDTAEATVKHALYQWYRERAAEVFARRMQIASDQLSWVTEKPHSVIREMKSRWGSCSPSGTIILNPHLVKAPTKCIDYVILHELCHLNEHNHSRRFYTLLNQSMPDWERVKMQLDGHSEFYLNI
jgi:hypothetical protein